MSEYSMEWNTDEMNKEVGYWLRKEFATEFGGHAIPEWTMVPISEYVASRVREYGDDMADYPFHYLDEGSTHAIRCITGSPFGLVDGVDLIIRVVGDGFSLLSEVDAPDYQGGEYKDAQKWLRTLAEPIDA